MLYRVCNNGRAVLLTREIKMLEGDLQIRFEGEIDGYTAVIKNGTGVYYRPIIKGVAVLPKKHICAGPVMITIIKDDKAEIAWICDELYAATREGSVAIAGNTLEYDKLLAEQRAEMDELRVQMKEFKAELLQFRQDFDEVYAGTEII